MASIGEMRFQLEFITVNTTSDGAGGQDGDPVVQLTQAASIRPATASEIDRAGRLQQQLTHIAEIRWRPDFEPKQGQVVRWRDRRGAVRVAYVNTAHDPDERGRFMVLALREGGPTEGVE